MKGQGAEACAFNEYVERSRVEKRILVRGCLLSIETHEAYEKAAKGTGRLNSTK